MSSILKALKRLEQKGETGVEETESGFDPRKTIARTSKRNYLKTRFISFSIIIMIVGAGIIFYFSYPLFINRILNLEGKAPKKGTPLMSSGLSGDSKIKERKAIKKDIVKKKMPVPVVKEDEVKKDLPFDDSIDIALKDNTPKIQVQKSKNKDTKGLDTSGLKLEAIVWAERFSSRFAVINGEIVRAGSMLRGVKLLNIGRDSVTFMKDGAIKRLEFRNR